MITGRQEYKNLIFGGYKDPHPPQFILNQRDCGWVEDVRVE
jgi:hypothetical protein